MTLLGGTGPSLADSWRGVSLLCSRPSDIVGRVTASSAQSSLPACSRSAAASSVSWRRCDFVAETRRGRRRRTGVPRRWRSVELHAR